MHIQSSVYIQKNGEVNCQINLVEVANLALHRSQRDFSV